MPLNFLFSGGCRDNGRKNSGVWFSSGTSALTSNVYSFATVNNDSGKLVMVEITSIFRAEKDRVPYRGI